MLSGFLILLIFPIVFYLRYPLRKSSLFSPFHSFWLAYIGMLVLEPAFELNSYQALFGDGILLKTVAMAFLVGITVIAGSSPRYARRTALRLPKVTFSPSPADLAVIGVILLAVAIAALVAVASQAGGWNTLLSKSRLSFNPDTSAYLYQLPDLWILGVLFLMGWRYRSSSAVAAVVAWAAWVLGMAWYAYIGSRSRVMILVVYLVIAKYSDRRIVKIRLPLILTVVALIPVMGFIGRYRAYFYDGAINTNLTTLTQSETFDDSFVGYHAFDNDGTAKTPTEYLMVGAVAQNVPDAVSFDYGYMLLEMFTRAVPRAIWRDKIYPESESWDRFHRTAGTTQYVNQAGYLAGPATPLPAKWFYMFGWGGLVLGGLYTGWLLRVLDEYVKAHSGAVRIILNAVFFMTGFAEMNNPFSWIYVTLPFLLLPSVLMLFVISRRHPNRLGRSVRLFRQPLALHSRGRRNP